MTTLHLEYSPQELRVFKDRKKLDDFGIRSFLAKHPDLRISEIEITPRSLTVRFLV